MQNMMDLNEIYFEGNGYLSYERIRKDKRYKN